METVFLIDSNVILDIFINQNNQHTDWSINTLAECADEGVLAINQIVYAEVTHIFSNLTELDEALVDYQRLDLPWEAAFIAGKAYAKYRKNGGKRHTLMPDFYIGAHATYANFTLVTRDKMYKTYFPTLQLITPH